MGRKEGEKSIYEVLIRTEEALAGRLRTVWDIAEKSILGAQTSDTRSLHVKAVERNLSRLIPDRWKGKKVNALELFVLAASSYLHDNGKIDPLTGDHGTTGAENIMKDPNFYGLTEKQAELIAPIIWVHTNRNQIYEIDEIRHLGHYEVHLRDLAALFCLADTLDCESERVLKGAKEGLPKTRFRRQISGWFLDDKDEDCIRLEATPKSLLDLECLWEGLEYIRNREIGPVSNQLKLAGYPSKIKLKIISDHLGKAKPITKVRDLPRLDFYTEHEENLFRGRQEEIEQLLANVHHQERVSLLSGKSGVGKTSLIRAGLFPILKKIEWKCIHTRLSSQEPVTRIVKDLWGELLSIDEPTPKGFVKALVQVAHRHHGTKILIVLDQFEEVTRVPIETLEDLQLGIRQVMARRFPDLRILISYQTESHDQVMHFLKSVSESVWQLPVLSLLPLTKEGARESLETLFASVQIGVDPGQLPDGRSVMNVILDDINAQGHGFYPPFLQIVAATLTDVARQRESLVTLELYKELGGAANIIGTFLLDQLNRFSSRKMHDLAENILGALVGEDAFIRQKSFEELQHETKIDVSVLRSTLEELEEKRLVRPLAGNKYEIIHSYLAQLVYQQLGEEKRETKRLRELLLLKSRGFASTHDFLSMTDLARLYCIRDRITPDKQEAKLLVHCCLAGIGPGWFWLRNYSAEGCLTFITEALSHPYERLRKNATEMIAALKGKEALPELERMLQDPRSSVRETAVWAIANLGISEALPELMEMLFDKSWAVREATIRALGKLQAREALSKIEKLLHDNYWQVRRATVEVLVQLGEIDKLEEWVKHPHWQIRAPAVKCLSELEGQKSLSWLRDMLSDPDWAVKTEVIRALSKLKDETSLEKIQQMADPKNEKDWRVREAAAEALVMLDEQHALQRVDRMLNDPDPYKRRIAVRLMAKLEGRNAVPRIAKRLKDRWWIVRIAAVKALTELDGEENLEKFFTLLKGENEKVRKALAQAIGKLGSDQFAMKLAKEIASLRFGEWGSAANDALVRIDRRLYCPFKMQLETLFGSTAEYTQAFRQPPDTILTP